ncbi:hypothetical protein MHU86_22731 [Fragilaria crotonensis]|nr:hypothetical protein MHU86_22731 [Fragilaria crotonensis]
MSACDCNNNNVTTHFIPRPDTLTSDPATWKGASLLSVTQITPSGLILLLQLAEQMKILVRDRGGDNRLAHHILGTVFFEASTRTACSFQAAMQRLGGTTIHVDGEGNSSANKKGESLSDTIQCLECYVDLTVLRHPVTGSVGQVVQVAAKPVLNAGDGTGEHPTQALLDLYTICNELDYDLGMNESKTGGLEFNSKNDKEQKALIVVMLGDLKHGRTVHSLSKLFAKWDQGDSESFTDMDAAMEDADVLYVTRVQKERFAKVEDYEAVKGTYVVNLEVMKKAPTGMIVLHPLPRVDEIDTRVDSDPRAAYFRQMENGMFVRMALLALVMGKVDGGVVM